jgi:topoisomerase-4 subunit A
MGTDLLPPGSDGGDHIEAVDLRKALEERYLAYALSTIMHRALPDVRDGLKPVHRRILHAMRLARLEPGTRFSKCAAIVGDVMGKFHPHGDQSIYDALVRLAQSFAMRYPLVDGQGNFGNIDGDSAAAMRYTEARMTEAASAILEGITEDAVDFRLTYNEEDKEPVGMATSIPPHNAAELCAASIDLIDNPEATVADLMRHVEGPDFPTGGIVVEDRAAMLEAYETGRGSFRVRSRWETEDQGRGTWVAVVTEIPYGVQKSRLIEKIAELVIARKLPLLEDVRDESAEDIRLVLVPKSRTVDPALMMESLFRLTELESRFPLNLNVLSRGKVPGVLSLKQVLAEWLAHRREVLQRRSRHRLAEIERRLEILGGYLIAYLNIDEVIRIIREEDEPKPMMMKRWDLTDVQAEAILNMRLRALRKLEEFEIRKEFDGLTGEKSEIEGLLASEKKQWATVRWQVAETGKKYAKETELGARRTTFSVAPEHDLGDIHHAMVEKEPVTVVVSQKGWLRAMKGHLSDYAALTFKEGDALKLAFHAQTTDKVLVFTTGGKFFTIGADRLPGGRGHGEPIRIMVDMENDQAIVTAFKHDPARKLLLVSHAGNGFVAPEAEMVANTRKGRQVMNVKAPDEAALCLRVAPEADQVAIVGDNRKLLIFPLAEIPEMTRGKGVRLQKYKDGGVKDAKTFTLASGLSWTDSADRTFVKPADELTEWQGARASAGRMVPKGFPRTGKF